MGGGELDPKHGHFMGPWGNFGSPTQKGIITYSLSSNRQKPFAGASRTAVFNTYRRCKGQFLYVVPPFAAAYMLMNWAIEKNEFYNSKEGRTHAPEASDEATQGGTYKTKSWYRFTASEPPKKQAHSAQPRLPQFFYTKLSQAPPLPSSQFPPLPPTMAKEKPPAESEEKRLKKEKKEKKRSETDGVHKPPSSKKDKKDKSSKKSKDTNGTATEAPATTSGSKTLSRGAADDMQMTTQLLTTLEAEKPGSVAVKHDDGDVEVKVKGSLIGALVPFANPLADEKVGKKVLKGVKRAAQHKTLKRGVKEVVKALRKSPTPAATTTTSSNLPSAIVVLAADISPMDVISHLPVLCEDHGIPYVFVTSRAELGAAGSTKRPTSVVMIGRDLPRAKAGKEKEKEKDGKEGWEEEVYADLVKLVVKAGRDVRI